MGYRDTWKEEKNGDKDLLNGKFEFQVHHLISKKSVDIAKIEPLLEKNGYDINKIENLEAYPCTFEGACTLRKQLHRGNHGDQRDEENYEYESHPRGYHDKVKEDFLDGVKTSDEKKPFCGDKDGAKTLEKMMDGISGDIRDAIASYEYKLTAATVANRFKSNSDIGCGNHTSIPKASADKNPQPCQHGRKH